MNFNERTENEEDFGVAPYSMPSQQMNGNMILMTNPEEELDKLEANFRGQVITNDGRVIQRFQKRMNEAGINQVMGILRSIVNRVTFMSNIDDRIVKGTMEHLAETLALVLMVNKQNFGIRSDADRHSIYFECLTLAHMSIRRGWQGDDKRFWGRTVQEFVNNHPNGMQGSNNGFLGKITPTSWLK